MPMYYEVRCQIALASGAWNRRLCHEVAGNGLSQLDDWGAATAVTAATVPVLNPNKTDA